jgi:hypothetical protein
MPGRRSHRDMADRGGPRVPLAAVRGAPLAAALAVALAIALGAGAARAAEIKTSGHLDIPPTDAVMAICTDPVVQSVLNQDFRLAKRSGPTQLVTVTVNARVLGPGASLQEVAPGDPEAVALLGALGAQPPLGDTGNKPINQFANQIRQQATMPQDPITQRLRYGQAAQQMMSGASAPSPYDSIPQSQIYDTAIVARATIAGSASSLHVVALVHGGDDIQTAKKLVAEEIASAILH